MHTDLKIISKPPLPLDKGLFDYTYEDIQGVQLLHLNTLHSIATAYQQIYQPLAALEDIKCLLGKQLRKTCMFFFFFFFGV